jgi:hypothetical protein
MAASINASTSAGVVTTADTTGNLNLQSNGTTVLAMTSAGIAVTGTLGATNLLSGTYTPSISDTTNVAASTMFLAQYIRVGNVVSVSGRVNIDPTSATTTNFSLTLPIASSFASTIELAGTMFANTSGAWTVFADASNDKAGFEYAAVGTANQAISYTYQYLII